MKNRRRSTASLSYRMPCEILKSGPFHIGIMKALVVLAVLLIVSQAALATPPSKAPCMDEVEDTAPYENSILSNEVIQRLNEELKLEKIFVYDCFEGGRLLSTLEYITPESFSSFEIPYNDVLFVFYLKDGTLETAEDRYGDDYKAIDYDMLVERFRERIGRVESNDRMREFILKMGPSGTPTSHSEMDGDYVKMTDWRGWITYSLSEDSVTSFLLPNDVEWESFPEIETAHGIVNNELVPNGLQGCSINKDSYTTLNSNYGDEMYMAVAITCDDGRKDVRLGIKGDGTYRMTGLQNYTVTRPGDGVLVSVGSQITGVAVLAAIIGVPLLLIILAIRRFRSRKAAAQTLKP